MKSMGISFFGHKYAPELFEYARVYGKPIILTNEDKSRLGYICITKGSGACIAEIKRIYRARLREKELVTIGFMIKGSKRKHCFTHSLSAYNDDLSGKFMIYKELKRYLLECAARVEIETTAVLGENYRIEDTRTRYDEIDLSRPVKIYFKTS